MGLPQNEPVRYCCRNSAVKDNAFPVPQGAQKVEEDNDDDKKKHVIVGLKHPDSLFDNENFNEKYVIYSDGKVLQPRAVISPA